MWGSTVVDDLGYVQQSPDEAEVLFTLLAEGKSDPSPAPNRSSTTSAATRTASPSATSASAVSTTARCASATPLSPERRLPQEDDDPHGDRVHPPHAAARAPARIPPYPPLRLPRQLRPAAEARRVPAVAGRAAANTTRKGRRRLQGPPCCVTRHHSKPSTSPIPGRLNRPQVLTLGTCAWLAERHNLFVTGPGGIGKSFLACAFVERACRRGFTTARYLRMPRLLHELAVGRADGSYTRLLTRLAKLDLLAIDDWMLAPLRDTERRDLTEVIEDRAERASTLIASQLPVTDWHAVIGDRNQADAICDRLLHDAHRIDLKGRSMRRTQDAPANGQKETT